MEQLAQLSPAGQVTAIIVGGIIVIVLIIALMMSMGLEIHIREPGKKA